jgi:hypothetical protein
MLDFFFKAAEQHALQVYFLEYCGQEALTRRFEGAFLSDELESM